MRIQVTKQMIDEVFDFIEGRRQKNGGYVLRKVRGKDFPFNLLRQPEEASVLSEYMDGELQSNIMNKYHLNNKDYTNVFRRVRNRYAKRIELYWNFISVMELIEPILQQPIEEIVAVKGKKIDSVIMACYRKDIMTIGDLIDAFTQYEVVVLVKQLNLEHGNKEIVFGDIRAACYKLLDSL